MTSDEAAVVLRQAIKDDNNIGRSLTMAFEARGYADLYDFVEQNPEMAISMAEMELQAQADLEQFALELEGGALGARPNDEPSA